MAKPGPKPGTHHRGTFTKDDPRRNPGGRPKDEREWKAWCRQVFNREEIRQHVLARMEENDNVLMWLGEQANGRASQSLEAKIDLSIGLRKMSDAELKAAIKAELEQLDEASRVA